MFRSWAVVLALLLSNQLAFTDEYQGAEVVSLSRGNVVFKYKGKTERAPVGLSLKIFDDKGEVHDSVTGTVRFLLPGNVVDIKTDKDKKTGKQQIVEIRFVSGKVGELPKAKAGGEGINLLPNPDFKGNVFGGDGVKSDPYWIRYIGTARVGDFIEFVTGDDKEPGRMETMEVGKDYVIIAKVFYILGTRHEQREKHRAPPGGAGKSSAPGKKSSSKSKSREKEELTVGDKKVLCETESRSGKVYRWKSYEVPFDGVVKYDSNVPYMLTAFGRGR